MNDVPRDRRRWWPALLAMLIAAGVPLGLAVVPRSGHTSLAPRAQPTGPVASPSPLPASVAKDIACPQDATWQHLSASQPPITDALICSEETRNLPHDGVWWFVTVRRIAGGLDDLLAAYSAPDAPMSHGACTADLPSPLIVYLHSDQGATAVRAPRDGCSKPQLAAREAYTRLTTTLVWAERKQQIQTQQSMDTHCVDAYKDVIEMNAEGSAAPYRGSSVPTPLHGELTVCRYSIAPDAEGDRIGHLVNASKLDDASAFDAALAKSTVDDSCSTSEHSRFALVRGSQGPTVVVALDGCALYEDQTGYFRAAEELRQLLR